MDRIYIIIVTHNSDQVLHSCLDHLVRQTVQPTSVVIVDSGSRTPPALEDLQTMLHLELYFCDNIGFSQANNLGFSHLVRHNDGLVLFLNPDCFLPPCFLETLQHKFSQHLEKTVVSGKLLGIDVETMRATGRIDSAGIFRKAIGRWYDRGRGELDRGKYDQQQEVPALCGALLCARLQDLKSLGDSIFDPDFFLYKEDIEFGMRLRKRGWKFLYHPDLICFHGRGWSQARHKMPHALRLAAARSEILLYRKHSSPYIVWAIAKYLGVRYGRL